MASFLVPLDAVLQSQPWLGGPTPCATDLAIFPFVRQFAAVEPRWFEAQDLRALRTWLNAWLGSDLFAASMIKLAPQTEVKFQAFSATRLPTTTGWFQADT